MDDTLKISSQVNQVHQFSAWSKDSEWAKPNGLIKTLTGIFLGISPENSSTSWLFAIIYRIKLYQNCWGVTPQNYFRFENLKTSCGDLKEIISLQKYLFFE